MFLSEFIELQYNHGLMFNMKSLQTALASACPILKNQNMRMSNGGTFFFEGHSPSDTSQVARTP